MFAKAATTWFQRGALVALCLACASPVRADPNVYERGVRSTVFILVIMPDGNLAAGSGALVDANKKIVVTNFHVAANMKLVVAFFPEFQNHRLITDREYYTRNVKRLGIPCQVVKADSKRDLAAIRLERLPPGVQELKLAAHSARPGETLHAIGNSGALAQKVLWRYSKGEVRQVYQKHEKSAATGGHAGGAGDFYSWVVETQIPSNHGDSGGPVLNSRGELVAVTASRDDSAGVTLVTFGIDVSEVRAFLRTAGVEQTASKSRTTARRN
jgi:S1-C subfamily serine protease